VALGTSGFLLDIDPDLGRYERLHCCCMLRMADYAR
jgi:hypothetical protein